MNEPVTPGGSPSGAAAAGMRSVLDAGDPAARRFPAGAITPSALPPVGGGGR